MNKIHDFVLSKIFWYYTYLVFGNLELRNPLELMSAGKYSTIIWFISTLIMKEFVFDDGFVINCNCIVKVSK